MKAIILLSGGMDSATALFWARAKGYRCHCLIFDYGQRHKREILSAKKIARAEGCAFDIIKISLPWKNASALTDKSKSLPNTPLDKIGLGPIPISYVPGRNTLFTAYAISAADALNAQAIVLGPNALDYSGYPDCRPEFYAAMRKAAFLGTRRGDEGKPIKILTPLINMTKAQIAKMGTKLGVPWEITWSCYAGGLAPCRRCDSCKLRSKGFSAAGIHDPAIQFQ